MQSILTYKQLIFLLVLITFRLLIKLKSLLFIKHWRLLLLNANLLKSIIFLSNLFFILFGINFAIHFSIIKRSIIYCRFFKRTAIFTPWRCSFFLFWRRNFSFRPNYSITNWSILLCSNRKWPHAFLFTKNLNPVLISAHVILNK